MDKRTRVINLIGGPGSGKSTTAAGLFYTLKTKGYDCEMALEFAKDKVWEESVKTLDDQIYIFGKQYHKIWRLNNKVDYIITDAPLLLSSYYNQIESDYFNDFIIEQFNRFDNLTFFIKRNEDHYEQNGRLPVWNMFGSETDMMIGYHSVPVIVDAYLKGIGDFDAESALKECVKTANLDDYRQIGLYKNMGYIPYDVVDKYNSENWSLSKTLEYAFDDYCIALMAEKMGKEDLADNFHKRASNYRNVFNENSSFMQPKDSKGNFISGFKPEEYTPHITESNGWQYLWSVQHDVDGLIELIGGKKRFEEKLDSMFTLTPKKNEQLPIFSTGMIGQYVHGNEPSHHVAYLYNYTDSPWKTQKYVSEIMHELYKNSPDGLCGNEDCGQMSAWYVMSAMGIYPVNPVSGEYQIGTPMFSEMQIKFADNKIFKILAKNVSRENCYVKSVKLNGVALEKPFINHKDIMKGGVIEFTMTDKPTKWGVIAEK